MNIEKGVFGTLKGFGNKQIMIYATSFRIGKRFLISGYLLFQYAVSIPKVIHDILLLFCESEYIKQLIPHGYDKAGKHQ